MGNIASGSPYVQNRWISLLAVFIGVISLSLLACPPGLLADEPHDQVEEEEGLTGQLGLVKDVGRQESRYVTPTSSDVASLVRHIASRVKRLYTWLRGWRGRGDEAGGS